MEKFMDFRDKLILAPMAGVCDQPFRLLCKEQGCDILYSEMVSAKAIYYKNKKFDLTLLKVNMEDKNEVHNLSTGFKQSSGLRLESCHRQKHDADSQGHSSVCG